MSNATLSLFLQLERCAAPLAESLGSLPESTRPGPEEMAEIVAAARAGTHQVLRAERDAREIGSELTVRNANAIVLKGGVPAVLGVAPPLTLHDIDLLVASEVRETLEEILKARGFTAAPPEAYHVCWYGPQGRLPVEIHWTTHNDGQPEDPHLWQRTVALDNAPGLHRLAWTDQVIHLVRHATEHHIDRHVTIRDLLLTGWFIGQLTPAELDRVQAAMKSFKNPSRSRAFLDFAREVHNREAKSDPFEDDAILHFAATILSQQGPLWSGGPVPAWHNAATVVSGTMSLPELMTFAGRSPATGIGAFASAQRYAPAAGALLTRGARVAHYFTSAVVGVPALKMVRRKVRERL